MGFTPFCCRRDDSSDRVQAKRRKDEGDTVCASKMPRTESGSTNRGVPTTAPKLEAVPVRLRASEERENGVKRRVVECLALYEEENTYPLERGVVKRAPEIVNLERLDMLDYIGHGQYLDAESLVDSR